MKRSSFILLLALALALAPAAVTGQALQTGDIRGRAMDGSGAVLPGRHGDPHESGPHHTKDGYHGSPGRLHVPGADARNLRGHFRIDRVPEIQPDRRRSRRRPHAHRRRNHGSRCDDGEHHGGRDTERRREQDQPGHQPRHEPAAGRSHRARRVGDPQNMAPQVVLDREDVGGSEGGLQAVFSTHGSTWHQNTYALNGVNVTDPVRDRCERVRFDYDSFQDVQISTAQHPADVGTPGVYFNQVTKSGTDKFHGGSAYYFENSNTVGDNLTQELKDQGVASGSSINLFSDWTAQLGGPLIRDKVALLHELARLAHPQQRRRLPRVGEHRPVLVAGECDVSTQCEEPNHRTGDTADVSEAEPERRRA